MKKLLLLAACGLVCGGQVYAQSAQKQTRATKAVQKQQAVTEAPAEKTAVAREALAVREHAKATPWPQLEAFHKVLSQTYHPAEKGDFAPIRKRASELSKAMGNLIGNPFPEAYRTSEMKMLVANLEERVAVVHKMATAKTEDKELMTALDAAHDIFHKIESVCKDAH